MSQLIVLTHCSPAPTSLQPTKRAASTICAEMLVELVQIECPVPTGAIQWLPSLGFPWALTPPLRFLRRLPLPAPFRGDLGQRRRSAAAPPRPPRPGSRAPAAGCGLAQARLSASNRSSRMTMPPGTRRGTECHREQRRPRPPKITAQAGSAGSDIAARATRTRVCAGCVTV